MADVHTEQHPIVGAVRWKATSSAAGSPIVLLDGWEGRNIKAVTIPELQGVLDARTDTAGDRFHGTTQFYGPAVPQLLAAFAAVRQAGLQDRILSYAGTFVPRLQRGSRTKPSNHSFGTAIDINPEWNPFHQPYARRGAKGSLVELVPFFEAHGFDWGGAWGSPDGMHFEVKRIMSVLPGGQEGSDSQPLEPSWATLHVTVNGHAAPVFAILFKGKAYVGIRALAPVLDTQLLSVTYSPMQVHLSHDGAGFSLDAVIFGDVGCVWGRELADAVGAQIALDFDTMTLSFTN